MSKQKWFSDPPPSIGWWPASVAKDRKALRWWDGSQWSAAVYKSNSAATVERMARTPSFVGPVGSIEWTHRPKFWPKRSRT